MIEQRSCFLHGDYTGNERCPGCQQPAPVPFGDAREAALRSLVEHWRARAAVTDTFHATMGIGWKVCATELEALLTGKDPQT